MKGRPNGLLFIQHLIPSSASQQSRMNVGGIQRERFLLKAAGGLIRSYRMITAEPLDKTKQGAPGPPLSGCNCFENAVGFDVLWSLDCEQRSQFGAGTMNSTLDRPDLCSTNLCRLFIREALGRHEQERFTLLNGKLGQRRPSGLRHQDAPSAQEEQQDEPQTLPPGPPPHAFSYGRPCGTDCAGS